MIFLLLSAQGPDDLTDRAGKLTLISGTGLTLYWMAISLIEAGVRCYKDNNGMCNE